MNEETQRRADLDSQRLLIDAEIEKLKQQREEIVSTFELSRENSSKFAESLEEVLSELENSDGGIQRMEVIVEELTNDHTLNAGKNMFVQESLLYIRCFEKKSSTISFWRGSNLKKTEVKVLKTLHTFLVTFR